MQNQPHPLGTGVVGIMSGENPRFPSAPGGHEALKAELDQMGHPYEEAMGHYGMPERSLIVHGIPRDKMFELGQKYGQESIIHGQMGHHDFIYTNGPDAGHAHPGLPEFGHWEANHPQSPIDNYTQLSDGSRFQLNFDWGQKHPTGLGPTKPQPLTRNELVAKARNALKKHEPNLLARGKAVAQEKELSAPEFARSLLTGLRQKIAEIEALDKAEARLVKAESSKHYECGRCKEVVPAMERKSHVITDHPRGHTSFKLAKADYAPDSSLMASESGPDETRHKYEVHHTNAEGETRTESTHASRVAATARAQHIARKWGNTASVVDSETGKNLSSHKHMTVPSRKLNAPPRQARDVSAIKGELKMNIGDGGISDPGAEKQVSGKPFKKEELCKSCGKAGDLCKCTAKGEKKSVALDAGPAGKRDGQRDPSRPADGHFGPTTTEPPKTETKKGEILPAGSAPTSPGPRYGKTPDEKSIRIFPVDDSGSGGPIKKAAMPGTAPKPAGAPKLPSVAAPKAPKPPAMGAGTPAPNVKSEMEKASGGYGRDTAGSTSGTPGTPPPPPPMAAAEAIPDQKGKTPKAMGAPGAKKIHLASPDEKGNTQPTKKTEMAKAASAWSPFLKTAAERVASRMSPSAVPSTITLAPVPPALSTPPAPQKPVQTMVERVASKMPAAPQGLTPAQASAPPLFAPKPAAAPAPHPVAPAVPAAKPPGVKG